MAGYLTVLKNNFAGTQAAEMGEDLPLTYFCRSRGTCCDITSARSIEAAPTRRHDGSSEGAPIPRKQLNASSSGPSNVQGVERGDLQASEHAARCHARSASTQPPRGAERRLKRRRAKGTKVAVGCTSMAVRSARRRA